MRHIIKNCFAVAAIGALCIWSLEPFALISFGLCAAGFGFAALCMHLTEDTPVSVSPRTTSMVYVTTEPTFGRPWNWNPLSWFPNSRVGHHHEHNAHRHTTTTSYFDPPRPVVHTHAPRHHNTIFTPAFTRAPGATVVVNNPPCSHNGSHQVHGHG